MSTKEALATTVRIPRSMNQALRQFALDHNVSANAIIVQAVADYLKNRTDRTQDRDDN